jgi:hypothetical protein
MMPWAGFFYYHTLRSFSCPMGGEREPITISYEGSLFSRSSLRPFIRPAV